MKVFFYTFPPKGNKFVFLFLIQFLIRFYIAFTVYTVLYSLYSFSFFVFYCFPVFLLFAQNCLQIPKEFIYTEESNTRCLPATCSPGNVRVRHIGFVELNQTKLIKIWDIRVGLWMTKKSSNQYGQHYQNHQKHAKN